MHTLAGHRRAVRALAYAPGQESLLASAGDDRNICLWEPSSGQAVATLESRRDGLLSLAFSPTGEWLAGGGRAGSLLVWNVQRREQSEGASHCSGPVVGVSFTQDGRAILVGLRSQRYGGEVGRLLCRNLFPPHPLVALGWTGDVESVAVAPARDLLAIAGQHRGIELWEVGRPGGEPFAWMPSRVRSLCFSPTGAKLAVATGREIRVYDLDDKEWTVECEGHRGEVHTVTFSPDATMLLSGGTDGIVRLWETISGRQLAAWDWKIGPVNAVAFSSDAMTAAAGGDKPQIVVWDVDEG